jgi:regulator of nucleoside diphosphate kinase
MELQMTKASKRPPIHMIEEEADALADLAILNQARHPMTTQLLLEEIYRARIYPASKVPRDVVTMGAVVDFVDEARSASRSVQLVYPHEADTSTNRISILTPLGAGLIGMRTGNSILWPDRSGTERSLTIVSVTQPKPDVDTTSTLAASR